MLVLDWELISVGTVSLSNRVCIRREKFGSVQPHLKLKNCILNSFIYSQNLTYNHYIKLLKGEGRKSNISCPFCSGLVSTNP